MLSDEEINARLRALTSDRDVEGVLSFAAELGVSGRIPPRHSVAIGQALFGCGEVHGALEWFERIGPADKPFEHARSQMARILTTLGEFDRVMRITEGYSDATIPDPLAFARTKALVAAGRNQEAVEFVAMIERERAAPANILEAAADAAIGLLDWTTALGFLDRAIASSDDPRLLLRRGVFLFHLDRLDECLDTLTGVKDIRDFYARAQSYIVRVRQRRSELDQMLIDCESLLARDPANEFGLETIIRQYLEARNFKAAESWFKKANKLLPERFTPEMYNFMKFERQGKLRRALLPFTDGDLDGSLTDGMKERVGVAYYMMGKYGAARRLARLITEPERSAVLKAKIHLASDSGLPLGNIPDNDEGRVIRALDFYRRAQFPECLAQLEATAFTGNSELGIRNLKSLAKSGRVLSNELFSRSGAQSKESGTMPIIQQLWVGSELSYIELLSIRSFLACGHETHLYTYDADIKVPPGCVVKDAREILPESEIFAHSPKTGRSSGSLAGFADLFRWKLIYEKGGAWADADVICLEPIRSHVIVNTELARVGTLVLPAVTNCFFAAEKGERAFLEAYEQSSRADRTELLWGEIGIHKMAEIVAAEGWGDRLTDPSDICPIPSYRIVDAIFGSVDAEKVIDDTNCRAIHLYNEVMRMVGFDKNGPFPDKGLIPYLEKRVSDRENGGAPKPKRARTKDLEGSRS